MKPAFWMPFGKGGCLWRTIVFLLGMILICALLSLLTRGCSDFNNQSNREIPWEKFNDPRDREDDRWNKEVPPELRDSSLVRDWNDSIPGIDELPAPDRNYIPPIDSTDIVPNPIDSIGELVGNRLIVVFNSTDIKADMTSFARQFKRLYPHSGYEILYYNPSAATMLLGVPAQRMVDMLDELPQRITGIDFIVAPEEVLGQTSIVPSDPDFKKACYDEYFRLIQAYDAWGITQGSPDVKVAIVDSYFDLTHPEIGERYVDRIHIPSKTVDVLPPAKAPTTETELKAYCHGTHVAGIAIGACNNNTACSGIAPKCSWIPIAVSDGGPMSSFSCLEGILYAAYHGADVINYSIGRSFPPGLAKKVPIEDQVEYSKTSCKQLEALWEYVDKVLNDHNCVMCTAAGNDSLLMGMDPHKRSESIIKVEAVDGKGIKADFSNYGKAPNDEVDFSTVSAPGINLWSATDKRCTPIWKAIGYTVSEKEGLQEMSGTSMASPVVTGAVALLKSKNKNLSYDEIKKILVKTAKQFDTNNPIGPTIQIFDALNETPSGEMLNFDDLMKDHSLLIGRWKSTRVLSLTDNDDVKIDELWTYFTFPTEDSGTLEYHALGSKRIYKANVSVKWGKNTVTFIQHGNAVASDGNTVTQDDFVCHPNSERLLEVSVQRNRVERFTFMLEKIQ